MNVKLLTVCVQQRESKIKESTIYLGWGDNENKEGGRGEGGGRGVTGTCSHKIYDRVLILRKGMSCLV